jgi:hypothetical protein
MSNRSVVVSRLIVEGEPLLINMIQNPTIDDVVETEARIYAASLDRQDPTLNDRRVPRDVREFLIRIGVEH